MYHKQKQIYNDLSRLKLQKLNDTRFDMSGYSKKFLLFLILKVNRLSSIRQMIEKTILSNNN